MGGEIKAGHFTAKREHATRLGHVADKFDEVADFNAEMIKLFSYGLLSRAVGGSGSPGSDAARLVGWALPNTSPQFRGAVEFSVDKTWDNFFGFELAKGLVDVLRIGDGVQEGTAWGYVTDGLRVLAIVTMGRAAIGHVQRGMRALSARSVIQMKSVPNCTWISGLKLLRSTGRRPFVTMNSLRRAVKSAGYEHRQGMFVYEMADSLNGMGVSPTRWGAVGSLDAVVRHTRTQSQGAAMLSIEYMDRAGGRGWHTLLARNGQFIDTYGKVFKSIAELRNTYRGATLVLESGVYYLSDAAVIAPTLGNLGFFTTLGLSLDRDRRVHVGLENMLGLPLEPVGIEIRGAGPTLLSLYPPDERARFLSYFGSNAPQWDPDLPRFVLPDAQPGFDTGEEIFVR